MSFRPVPGLGPHCVGLRVVVRRVLTGRRGTSGGPAMTDLLGVMESWSDQATTIRAEDGTVTTVALADIVSGKPVPPRPSARLRVSADQATRRANASWPPLETEPLGDWLLRAAGGFSARANSVMASGDPGLGFEAALERVHTFYDERGLPPWAQVTVGTDVHADFRSAGWVNARPGEADSLFQMVSVAGSLRALRSLPAISRGRGLGLGLGLTRSTTVGPAWLASDARAAAHREAAIGVLEGPEHVLFVSALPSEGRDEPTGRPLPATPACRGRAAVDGDWVGVTDVWVSTERRQRGLASQVLHELLEWAAERGATTAYLQVRGDNPPALAAYARLGFVTHHAYRYLAPRP